MSILSGFIEKRRRVNNPIKYWREKGAIIGEFCSFHRSASLGSEPYLINIGNHVRLNNEVSIVTHDGGMWVLRELYPDMKEADLFGPVKIGNNVYIGTNVMIMPNVKIENNCIIGSCTVVTKDVPDNSIAVGIPAKIIEDIETYKKKHENDIFKTKNLSATEKKESYFKSFKERYVERNLYESS